MKMTGNVFIANEAIIGRCGLLQPQEMDFAIFPAWPTLVMTKIRCN